MVHNGGHPFAKALLGGLCTVSMATAANEVGW